MIGKTFPIIKTNPIDIMSHDIYLAWGVTPDPSLPMPIKVTFCR